jgi:hypothetical protein
MYNKPAILLLLLASVFIACNKESNKTEEQIEEPIEGTEPEVERHYIKDSLQLLGKWRLDSIKIEGGITENAGWTRYEFSQNNIVFEFKQTGIMTVSGFDFEIDYFKPLVLYAGDYIYFFWDIFPINLYSPLIALGCYPSSYYLRFPANELILQSRWSPSIYYFFVRLI